MHIVCCVKQVPDTAQVKIDPDTNTLIRSGVESICSLSGTGHSTTFVALKQVIPVLAHK